MLGCQPSRGAKDQIAGRGFRCYSELSSNRTALGRPLAVLTFGRHAMKFPNLLNVKIDFEKIVNQALTTLVVGAFVGACVIVWRGATTVDTKVSATETRLETVINQLSDKLATYELQIQSITNQLATFTKVLADAPLANRLVATNAVKEILQGTLTQRIPFSVEQKARSRDIYEQLKK